MTKNGLRSIDGVNVLPLDGMWRHISEVPADKKLSSLLEYSGCNFYDDARKFVGSHVVALAGVGGLPIAYEHDSDNEIQQRLQGRLDESRLMMGSAAAFSYLNIGEKPIDKLYETVAKLGHYSIAHTVQVNFVVAGISEAAELELNLQRDIVHLSKLTNARTRIQNQPPIVVRDPSHLLVIQRLYKEITKATEDLRTDETGDTLEAVNGLYPVNKATALMVSGSLNNLRKLALLRDDNGKERELRDIANNFYEQLAILWPEIIKEDKEKTTMETFKGERQPMNNDYFADGLLEKLDTADPIYAAYEAQAVSRDVGFDFADFQDVVPRALDEIRETKEAFEEEGPEGREHFGDELADIMFSLTNLARHAGITNLAPMDELINKDSRKHVSEDDTIDIVNSVGDKIAAIADVEKTDSNDEFVVKMNELLESGVADIAQLARVHGFDPTTLLRENVRKYLVRCQAIEQLAEQDGKQWADLAENNEIVAYWKKAKILLK